ncbi:MAG TPA: hypothetical protein VG326_17655 [Tepidisphaeraceae bacterium]|jgi:hypothetical protein|nr:hypothetical protein [Tepidisphaeraceae bacterium]
MNSFVHRAGHDTAIGRLIVATLVLSAMTAALHARDHCAPGACAAADAAEPPAGPSGNLHPIPSADALAGALQGLKEIFKPYPPAKAEDKIKVAEKLISDNEKSPGDLNSQYVLLHEAAELFAAAGDLPAALKAVDDLAGVFAIDVAQEKLSILKRAKVGRLSPSAASAYADATLTLGWGAMRRGDFESANRAVSLAAGAVHEAQDPKLTSAAQALTAEAHRALGEAGQARAAEEKLKTQPNDPSANLGAGRFLCFYRGDWTRGLPMLAKGSDPTLKALAESDLAPPTDADAQLALGQKWGELAGRDTTFARAQLRQRATYWYALAEAGLGGLKKVLAQRRIADLNRSDASDPASFTSRELTLAKLLNDPSHWIVKNGKWDNATGRFHGEGDAEIDLDTPLPPDIVFSFHINVISGSRPRMHFEGTGMTFANEGRGRNLYPHGTKAPEPHFMYENNQPHALKFKLAANHFEIAIDGNTAFTGTYKAAKSIHLRLRAGDSWSRGTTEFWGFEVESLPNGMGGK